MTKEGGEDKDEGAENSTADKCAHVNVGDTLHLPVYPARGPQKEDGNQPGKQTQPYVERDVTHQKGLQGIEGKHHCLAPKEDRHYRSRDGGDQQRHDNIARKIKHQHFKGEYDCRNGCLEDGSHRRCGTACQQKGGVLAVHFEEACHVGSDG